MAPSVERAPYVGEVAGKLPNGRRAFRPRYYFTSHRAAQMWLARARVERGSHNVRIRKR